MPPGPRVAWKYFRVIETPDPEGGRKPKKDAFCKFCDQKYQFPNATRLSKHLLKCRDAPDQVKSAVKTEEIEKGRLETEDDNVDDPPENSSSSQTQIVAVSPNNDTESTASSLKRKKQGNMSQFMDTISQDTISKADKLFAKAAYYGGLPCSVYENNPYFKEACQVLRPAYPGPPNLYKLRKPLLEAEYEVANITLKERLKKAVCKTVMCDGWTNCKSDGLINFMVGTPEIQFLKAVESQENRQTGDYIGTVCESVVDDIGSESVLHLVTDFAPANRVAWRKVNEKYPHIFTTGCVAHGLDLLCEDLVKMPFLAKIKKPAKAIVKIKNTKVTHSLFKKKQKQVLGNGKSHALCMPSPTRFHGDEMMFESVMVNKEALIQLALSRPPGLSQAAKTSILDEKFWEDLGFAISLLKPIAKGIKTLESDNQLMSLVPLVFMDIKNCMLELFEAKPDTPEGFVASASKALDDRMNFCIFDIHKAAYLLDPRFKGQGLSDSEVLDALEVIKSIANHLDLNSDDVIANVTAFRNRVGFFDREILWARLSAPNFKPADWWLGLCNQQAARPVAERILQLHPTACGCERNWSEFKFIQHGRRNRLDNARAAKLVSVRHFLHKDVKNRSLKKRNRRECDVTYYLSVTPTPLYVHYDPGDIPLAVRREVEESDSDFAGTDSDSDSNSDVLSLDRDTDNDD
ncbi:hypothetical protein ONE63_006717 [Megalurothrips usitatus]|uniref:DUF659 domain-containing protein n=1 Tax=Megalurothrips usitatus TaxID=439358 RepID=A0AAV7Y1L8_9NEOP|nr:hypothetical protein ONE63_006717 [Megalurothrips usitatus]